MKLSFHGANYEAHFENIQVTDTERIGTYRGAPLKRKAFKVPDHDHQRVQLTYRGVKYNHEL
ncbi:DUF4278 domain-containing protein [Leptothoe kymatousa]|uniref:DUF4278 domain-containing protein n=1 Tax=Leptothoe kymatousa TAU-MAC 1615 TaxID=2364775 RepID=A0ABS5Y0Y3_9CYAN|nr:DUF4278 domain-containing protein [Leptothoe kymatousa]MBT9311266.1 DUF4278 domain-containing protein [Leptothoe kymatousa TAU-MAC 1615]